MKARRESCSYSKLIPQAATTLTTVSVACTGRPREPAAAVVGGWGWGAKRVSADVSGLRGLG